MGSVTMWKCDGCGKTVENPYAERGWIQFGSVSDVPSITRAVGHYNGSSYETDYIRNVRDFCSIECLNRTLDRIAEKRKAPAVTICGSCGQEKKK